MKMTEIAARTIGSPSMSFKHAWKSLSAKRRLAKRHPRSEAAGRWRFLFKSLLEISSVQMASPQVASSERRYSGSEFDDAIGIQTPQV